VILSPHLITFKIVLGHNNLMKRLLLADDHPMMLQGMSALLAQHYEIAGTAADGRDLVEAALRLVPDLIVTDITLPSLNGIDAAIQIKKRLPEIKLIFITMHSNSTTVKAAFEAGASGYVLKSSGIEELLDAISSVLGGGAYVSPHCPTEDVTPLPNSDAGATNRLSMRERETLQLIAEGRSSKEIAFFMNLSLKTVEFHREGIRRKLGVGTTAELTQQAIALGLVQKAFLMKDGGPEES
jgi:DNA-binding NarL/FixJ family response regulator